MRWTSSEGCTPRPGVPIKKPSNDIESAFVSIYITIADLARDPHDIIVPSVQKLPEI